MEDGQDDEDILEVLEELHVGNNAKSKLSHGLNLEQFLLGYYVDALFEQLLNLQSRHTFYLWNI